MGVLCLNNKKKRENVCVNLHEWHVEVVAECVSGGGQSYITETDLTLSKAVATHTEN